MALNPAQIYDPRFHTFDSWASLMCELYAPQQLEIPHATTDWRKWGNGIRAIGPNALSPINTATHLAISFHPIQKMKTGGLSLIFQSGLYEPRIDWL